MERQDGPVSQTQADKAEDADLWFPPLTEHRRAAGSVRRRRAPSALTRDRIVAAAIAVADSEGADAIGMRRVARELGAGPMSLYWHVTNKEELIALMIDAVEGEYEIPAPSDSWRADITSTARNMREVLLRHGWMANFVGFRRSVGPNELPHLEHSLATLSRPGLGLGLAEALRIMMAVETYVLGFALRDQQEQSATQLQHAAANNDNVVDPDTTAASFHDYLTRLRATHRFPHISSLFDQGIALTLDERFDYGLECLLDGIELNLKRRRSPKKRLANSAP